VTRYRERRISKLGRGLVRNQRIAFRDGLTPERSRDLLWGWARHMTHLVVDFCRMNRITRANLEERVDLTELSQIRELQAEGGGVICAGGHIGVFVLGGHVGALAGLPAVEVMRPPDNPAIRALLRKHRIKSGLVLLKKWGVLWSLRKSLRRGEVIGLAVDENDRKSPAFAPFLGTMASANSTAALMQRNTGAPIAVVTVNRVSRGRYKFHVWEVIRNPKPRDHELELQPITRQISIALTRAILTYPEQWLWGSRRFQTRPPGEELGPDGLPPQVLGLATSIEPSPATAGS
jgi:lauroyl/myristoyl acyltransferase